MKLLSSGHPLRQTTKPPRGALSFGEKASWTKPPVRLTGIASRDARRAPHEGRHADTYSRVKPDPTGWQFRPDTHDENHRHTSSDYCRDDRPRYTAKTSTPKKIHPMAASAYSLVPA